MRNIEDYIKSIEQKVNTLLKVQEILEKKNQQLTVENSRLKEEVAQCKRDIVIKNNAMSVLKREKNKPLSSNEQKDLDKLLETYIQEIDQCIATLSKQA